MRWCRCRSDIQRGFEWRSAGNGGRSGKVINDIFGDVRPGVIAVGLVGGFCGLVAILISITPTTTAATAAATAAAASATIAFTVTCLGRRAIIVAAVLADDLDQFVVGLRDFNDAIFGRFGFIGLTVVV